MNPLETSLGQGNSYDIALEHLAQAQARKILRQGENIESELTKFLRTYLKTIDAEIILSTYSEHMLLKQHTHSTSPSKPGLYLRLSHGRQAIDEALDGWGDDGPWIGPLRWFHCTYLQDFGIGFENGEELNDLGLRLDAAPPMLFEHDMIYLDGMYYGCWDLVQINNEDISK